MSHVSAEHSAHPKNSNAAMNKSTAAADRYDQRVIRTHHRTFERVRQMNAACADADPICPFAASVIKTRAPADEP